MDPADPTVPAGDVGASRQEGPLERGTIVGRYVVLQELGAGGMGIVYAAYDPELDRKVALKLLHADPGGTTATDGHRRLAREAQAMAKLSHPNVIAVHDVGDHDGRVFVAMEFVDGETLSVWRTQERKWTEVLDVFVHAGRGLAAAHDKGLVHRDFKPDNVMVGVDGRVRVMDFGLARATTPSAKGGHLPSVHSERSQPRARRERSDGEASAEPKEGLAESRVAAGSDLTKRGSIMGTPAYMAPEQHLGLQTDARTDQFSFCVALWEGLYGQRPFSGQTVAALAFNVSQGLIRDAPTRTAVPSWLRTVLARGLAVEPDRRFASMAVVLEAIAQGSGRRRRRLVVVGAAAFVFAGASAWGGWQFALDRSRAACATRAAAIEEVWNNGARADLREALVGTGVSFAETTFARSLPLLDARVDGWRASYYDLCVGAEVGSIRSAEQWAASQHCLAERRDELELLLEVLIDEPDAVSVERTVEAIAALERLDPCADDVWLRRNPAPATSQHDAVVVEARRRLWRAQALAAAGDSKRGLALAREVVQATSEHGGLALRARALRVAGSLASDAGAYEAARGLLGDGFDLALAAGEDELARIAATKLAFVVGHDLAEHGQGLLWGRVAHALQRRHGSDEDLAAADIQRSEAAVYQAQGRYDEAERANERVLATYRDVLGSDHPVVAAMYNNLGTIYDSQGRYDEAEKAYEHALAIHVRVHGPDHPQVASAYNNLGVVYRGRGRIEQAERSYRKALEIWENAHGPNHPHVAFSYNNLGPVYELQGRAEDAERAYQRGLEIWERVVGPDHPNVGISHHNLAALHDAQGRHAEAERGFASAFAILEQVHGSEHPIVAGTLVGLSEVRRKLGRIGEAVRDGERALAILSRQGAHATELAQAQFVLARALFAANKDRARARGLATQALDAYRAGGKPRADERNEVETWLSEHVD